MPNWHKVFDEISSLQADAQKSQQDAARAAANVFDVVRRKYLSSLSDATGRNVIAYYSAFLTKTHAEGIDITDDDKNAFMTCINGMDRTKGLDIILHTPGGGIAATESLVHYLRQMFNGDIRAVVPQIAMSAGTMLALSCRSIVMGKQSCLGPIDPQIAGVPADVVVAEFKRAVSEIGAEPIMAHVWAPILGRYGPTFLSQCEFAVEWSRKFVRSSLIENMLRDHPDKEETADKIVEALSNFAENKAHNKHIHSETLHDLNVKVERLEDNQEMQDLFLTVHHCYMQTLSSTTTIKIVESNDGRAVVRHMIPTAAQQQISIGFGGPS